MVFVSISIDKDVNDMRAFLEKNPKYDWVFLHFGGDETVQEAYNIKIVPMYFFIDPKGNFIESPAMRPSEGIEEAFDKLKHSQKKKDKIGEK